MPMEGVSVDDRLGTVSGSIPWLPVVASAILAGLVAGLLFHYQLFILQLFGSLVGLGTIEGGAAVHAVVSLLLASLFGRAVTMPRIRRRLSSGWRLVLGGMAYGVVLFLLLFGIALPLVTTISPLRALPVPYWPLDGLLIHVLFGVVLGGTFAVVGTRDA